MSASNDRLLTASEVAVLAGIAGAFAVDAGPNRTIRLPQDTVVMNGGLVFDGDPTEVALQWSAPAGVTFDDDTILNAVATFAGPGTYVLDLTATHGVDEVSDALTVVVQEEAELTTVSVTPATALVFVGETVAFDATGRDQYGDVVAITPSWSATGGTISTAGVYTAGGNPGTFEVTAIADGIPGSATVTVSMPPEEDDGLIAYWRFDEAAGLVAVDDVEGRVGNLLGGTLWTTGLADGALFFDGVNDRVEVGDTLDFVGNAPFTISAWIKVGRITPADQQTFVAKWRLNTGQRAYRFDVDEMGRLNAKVADGTTAVGSTPLVIGEWTHALMTVDPAADAIRVYRNGLEDGNVLGWTGSIPDVASLFVLGRRSDAQQPFQGAIDNLRIYDRVLTAAEIALLAGNEETLLANAGPDQNIRLPQDSTTVIGQVIHASGGPLVTLWSGPAGVVFEDPGALETLVAFPGVGTYELTFMVDDGPDSASDAVIVMVEPAAVLTHIALTPAEATLAINETQQFAAQGTDQYGEAFPITPQWAATGGTIDGNGLYTAGATAGGFEVSVTDGGVTGMAPVTVTSGPTLDGSLVAHWKFNEGVGSSTLDEVTATLASVIGPSWIAGVQGAALAFSSANHRVNAGDILDFANGDDFTIAAWIRVGSINPADQQTFIGKWTISTTQRAYRFDISETGTLNAKVNGNFVAAGTTPLTVGVWYHAAMCVSQSTDQIRVYLNGVEDGVLTGWTGSIPATTAAFTIGRRSDGQQPFNGAIDDVRVYDRMLTPAEIASLAQ